MKTTQIQFFPTKKQRKLISLQLNEHRNLYNECLNRRKIAFENEKIKISTFDLIKSEIPKHRKLSNCSSMQQTVRRLDKSFQKFFKEKRGYPRFKGIDRFNTIQYIWGDGIGIKKGVLYIQNVGQIKCNLSRIDSKIISCSVTKKHEKYYLNFAVENFKQFFTKNENSTGIDIGLKTFVTTSNGEKFESPKFHKKSLKEEAKIRRRIHRSKKGSKSRSKHKKSLVKLKRKISNRRKDFNHKLSRNLVDRYDILVFEDIKLSDLITNINNINRTYADVAIGQFRDFVFYKAENAGKIAIKVPAFNTTKECSNCGNIVEKSLQDRKHICECGYSDCRDINAAKNILRRGLASLDKNPRGLRL